MHQFQQFKTSLVRYKEGAFVFIAYSTLGKLQRSLLLRAAKASLLPSRPPSHLFSLNTPFQTFSTVFPKRFRITLYIQSKHSLTGIAAAVKRQLLPVQ